MAQITQLQQTNTLGITDETILRQGSIDKRISLKLANFLSWAARNDFTFIGMHVANIQFLNAKSFSIYSDRAYFVKSGVSLPYSSPQADPSTDSNLEVYSAADGKDLLQRINAVNSSLTSHANDKSNPHSVTKSQVGLGNVGNYSISDSTSSDSSASYASSKAIKSVSDRVTTLKGSYDSHAANTSNPHAVTKAQVGLGSVHNYGIYHDTDSTSTVLYASAAAVKKAYDRGSAGLSSASGHIANRSNPHAVTKAQVGLGNVDNYSSTSSVSSSSTSLFATAAAAKTAYDKGVEGLNAANTHAAIVSGNPHKVTKANVGLGSVANFSVTSSTTDSSNSKYATAGAVKSVNDKATAAKSTVDSHVGNTSNPHGVTKSQVGLGNVANYGVTTSVTSTSTTTYATASAVRAAYNRGSSGISAVNSHAARKDNPHTVSKSQVGLSRVPNYSISDRYDLDSSGNFASTRAVHRSRVWASGAFYSRSHLDTNFLTKSSASSTYLTRGGKAADADKLDGVNSSSFLRSDANDSFSGDLVSTNRSKSIFGVYDSRKTDQIWSMGTSYRNSSAGTNFGNLYGLAYKHTNNPTGGTMAGGHQMVWVTNGAPQAAFGDDGIWSSGVVRASGTITAGGDVVAFSDARVKTDLEVIGDALSKVKRLRGLTYQRTDKDDLERSVGVIAQEVEKVLPEAVMTIENEELGIKDFKTVKYGNMVALLIEAVKELSDKVDNLK